MAPHSKRFTSFVLSICIGHSQLGWAQSADVSPVGAAAPLPLFATDPQLSQYPFPDAEGEKNQGEAAAAALEPSSVPTPAAGGAEDQASGSDLAIIPDLKFKPFSFPRTKEQAQATVNAAEQRPFIAPNMRQDAIPFLGSNSQQDILDFTNLVRANRLIEIIDSDVEQMEFMSWFFANKEEHVGDFVSTVKETVHWQQFLAGMWVKYTIQTKPPQTAFQKILSQASDVLVMVRSNSFYIVAGIAILFIIDVAKGGLVAGPIAGGMNAFLGKWIVPITQWLTVTGVRLLGPSGERLNAKLFQSKVSLNFAKNTAFGRTFELKNPNFSSYLHQTAFSAWNSLSRVWDLLPDVLRVGRTHFADHVVFRPADFSQRLTNHISAAETSILGAEQTRNAIMSRNQAQAREIYDVSNQLLLAVGEEMKLKGLARAVPGAVAESPQNSTNTHSVKQLEGRLLELGAFPGETQSMMERFRRTFAFLRAGAAIIAVEKIHNVHFADLIEVVQGQYGRIRENLFVSFFEPQVKQYVLGILNSVDMKANLVETELKLAGEVANAKTADVGKRRETVNGSKPSQAPAEQRPVEKGTGEQKIQQRGGKPLVANTKPAAPAGQNMKAGAAGAIQAYLSEAAKQGAKGPTLKVISGVNKGEGIKVTPGGYGFGDPGKLDPRRAGKAAAASGARR